MGFWFFGCVLYGGMLSWHAVSGRTCSQCGRFSLILFFFSFLDPLPAAAHNTVLTPLPVVLFLLFFLCRHPDQPKSKRPAAAAPQQAAQQQEGSSAEQQLETDSEEFEPKQHSA